MEQEKCGSKAKHDTPNKPKRRSSRGGDTLGRLVFFSVLVNVVGFCLLESDILLIDKE